jgi:putative membrane protein
MKTSLKNVQLLFVGCSLMLATAACNSSTSSSSTTDTTATASAPAMDTATPAPPVDANKDQDFVTDVVKANRHEIMMLKNGIANGTNKTLKSDARKMLADHEKVNTDLVAYAGKKNIALPDADTTMKDDISAKPGKDWDKAWTDDMVEGHQKTITRFEKGQQEVGDQDLKDWITKTLPTLHAHLDMMQQLQTSMK